MFDRANTWTENHLSSCKSYRKNNHFGRRLAKWEKIYSRVLGCDRNDADPEEADPEEADPEEADPEESEPEESEPECGCYAKDEEIQIANDKCVLDMGTFPAVGGFWSLTFDMKINSLPADSDWYVQMLSVKKDFNGFPYELTSVNYEPNDRFAWMVTKGSIHSPGVNFDVGQWYKITISGRPDGEEDGVKRCEQTILLEGPGLNGYISGEGYVENKWTTSNTNDCLDLEGYPLKVYTTRDLTYANQTPVDGVVRNFSFTNTAVGKTMDTTCYEELDESDPEESEPVQSECGCYAEDEEIQIEEGKCVFDMSEVSTVSADWRFTFDLKINSLPDGPIFPSYYGWPWFAQIIEGKVNNRTFY